jgi:APA family basic amino acid/polyamine antiporter
MSRDKLLPPQVARIHPRFRTPAVMTMVTGSIVTILAAVFPLNDLLKMVNIGTLAAFAVVCIGVLALRIINPKAERPFKAPLVWVFGVLGSMSCLYLIYGLDPMTWLRYAGWFLIGMFAYFGYGFWNSRMRASMNR